MLKNEQPSLTRAQLILFFGLCPAKWPPLSNYLAEYLAQAYKVPGVSILIMVYSGFNHIFLLGTFENVETGNQVLELSLYSDKNKD